LFLPILTTPLQLASDLKKDPTNSESWGEAAGLFILVKGGTFTGAFKEDLGYKVDLMGGEHSRYGSDQFINYDMQAQSGIRDGVENFKNHFGDNTVSQIIVDNPQADFLEPVTDALKTGGTITVRGACRINFFGLFLMVKPKDWGIMKYSVSKQMSIIQDSKEQMAQR
jgi:hypothetical protein